MKRPVILLLAAVSLSLLSACDKKMEQINTDPNSLSTLPDSYLFTTALRNTFGSSYSISLLQLRFGGQYAHVFTTNTEDRSADEYNDFHTQDVYRMMWENFYTSPLVYINKVLELTGPGGTQENPVHYAIADIIAVMNFASATDCYGDIPYREGARGSDGILFPKYDTQDFIYHDLMNRLKNDISELATADPAMGYIGTDPAYNNDLTKWAKLANSMRLRLAMRARFADPTNSAAVITECLAQPLLETNDDNFILTHQESDNSDLYNPWYDVHYTLHFKMSTMFIDWLQSTNDPRLQVLVDTTSKGQYVGVPNGLNDQAFGNLGDWEKNYSDPAPILYAKAQPQYLMCASEIWFLRAEAALFGLGSGDPNQLYQQGIRSNLEMWNVQSADENNFIDTVAEASLYGSDENKFRQIGTQMWIAFVPNYIEAWSNIRRTGYPVIAQRTDANIYSLGVTNGILPKRFKYASTEYINNKANVDAAVSIQGQDKIDTPVWWDVHGGK